MERNKQNHQSYIVKSIDEMHALAARIAAQCTAGDILLLFGDLGSGKTTFVQGLARALGIRDAVTSPSFTIAGEYQVPHRKDILKLVHVDLYRLEAVAGTDAAYIKELFEDARRNKQLIAVEWADRLGNDLPSHAWRLEFQHGINPAERMVIVNPPV